MALQTSSAFRQYYRDGRAPLVRATLHLTSGDVVEVGGDRIAIGGVSVTGATSPSGAFSIGSAIVGTATVTLADYDGWLDQLDLEDARILVYAGADVGAAEPEWALLGTYDVATPETRGRTYPLQCRDYMARFEVPYSEVGTTYPATLSAIVQDICTHVGVSLAQTDFANASHVVASRPTDELSCIDMVEFVAQLSCSYARMTPEGLLSFGWYDPRAFDNVESWLDGGTFSGSQTPYVDGDAANGGGFMWGGQDFSGGGFEGGAGYAEVSAIRSLTTGTDDITITGLRVTAMDEVVEDGEGAAGETYRYGTTGYELAIEGNPLVPYGSAEAVARMVAPHVVGLTFRTADADVIGDPSLQAGDAMVLTDRFGGSYRSYVTQVTWGSGGSQRLACEAVAPSRKAMAGRTGRVTRALARISDSVRRVTGAASAAGVIANEAKGVADAINQHFWLASDGVHVTQVSQDSWGSEPSGPNILINSLGQLLRVGLNNLATVTQSAIAFYDGLGNGSGNIIARFGRDGAQIGASGGTNIQISSDMAKLTASDGDEAARVEIEGVWITTTTGERLVRYGTRLTNTRNLSFVSIAPAVTSVDGEIAFSDEFDLDVVMNSSSFHGATAFYDNVTLYGTLLATGSVRATGPVTLSGPASHRSDVDTSVITDIITPNDTNVTVTAAHACVWGRVCALSINFTNEGDISVPAHGNVADLAIGTLASGLRPAVWAAAVSHGDNAGQCFYSIGTNGAVVLGAVEGTGTARTIAAGTTFNLHATYLLP